MVVTCLNVLPSVFRKVANFLLQLQPLECFNFTQYKNVFIDVKLKVLDVPHILYEEECWIDTNKRIAHLKSRPLGYQNYAVLTESSTFSAATENPNW